MRNFDTHPYKRAFAMIQIISFGSHAYAQSLGLRDEVLRKPLGLSLQHPIAYFKGNTLCGTSVLQGVDPHRLKLRAENWAAENDYSTLVIDARRESISFYELGIPHCKMRKDV